jgi:hypothetical protein
MKFQGTSCRHLPDRSEWDVETTSLCMQIEKNLGYVKLQYATKQETPVIVTDFLRMVVPI